MSLVVISYKDAKAKGLKRFFTGVPCMRGHISERNVANMDCCDCASFRVRKRWRENPLAKQMDKAIRDKKREKIRAYDRMRAKRDRVKKKAIYDRWVANNPERNRKHGAARSHRRRAKVVGAGGSWSATDVTKALAAQKNTCWWCPKKLKGKYHIDHRFPISKNGTNAANNIVISCAPCNRSKSAKMPWEFAGRLL